jgi:hypothetical protein
LVRAVAGTAAQLREAGAMAALAAVPLGRVEARSDPAIDAILPIAARNPS